jgi:1-acyl-sn-glycerol-3-phosphate acyltransferase
MFDFFKSKKKSHGISIRIKLRQGLRYSRLGVNLLSGGAFIASCYRFPSISKIKSKYLNDFEIFSLWVKDLNYSMNVKVSVSGEIMSEHGLFVSNHISWLDTIVLSGIKPLSFIARHDLENWPLLGTFTARMQSVFINRDNKFHAYRSLPAIEKKLNEGRSVHVFPEGTTSVGRTVLPFYPMFYEAAVRTGRPVQAIVIHYTNASGKLLPAPAYIDDDTFGETLARMFLVDQIYAHVHFLSPMDSKKIGRKEMSSLSRNVILQKLQSNNVY